MVNSIKGYNSYRNFGYLYIFVEKYRPIFYIKFINLLIYSCKLWTCSKLWSNDSRSVLRSPDLNQIQSPDLNIDLWTWSSFDLNQTIRNLCSKVLIWIKWFTIHAPKSWSESNDSQYTLQSLDLNQMTHNTHFKVAIWIIIHKPDLMFRSKSNNSQSELQSLDLNQMIHNTRSKVLIWIKWFTIHAPKSWSESNDSQYTLQSLDLNQMIHNTRSKVLIWIKWFTIHAPKSWSESNDSQYTLQSRNLNNDSQTRSDVPI